MTRAQRARGEGDEERGCGRSRSTRRATGSSYDYWGSRLHVHSCETVLRISGVTLGVRSTLRAHYSLAAVVYVVLAMDPRPAT